MNSQPFDAWVVVYNGEDEVTRLTFTNNNTAYFYVGTTNITSSRWSGTATLSYTGAQAVNYCKDGYTYKLYMKNRNGHVATKLTKAQFTMSTDATTSTVPCTVYYYPST